MNHSAEESANAPRAIDPTPQAAPQPRGRRIRLAIVVSHPIQYYVPIYRLLAARDDLDVHVFFSWHGGNGAEWDRDFGQPVAWDIPLTEGFSFDVALNRSRTPSSHHFFGIRGPDLTRQVFAWRPDAVHVTGYAFDAHMRLLRALAQKGIPTLFRGDSHLLSPSSPWKSWLRRQLLSRVYRWPTIFLYVGRHNRDYYRSFGVPDEKLLYCPHSIDVARFAEPADEHERQALAWRHELGIRDDQIVFLFAGKFQHKKRPVELMRTFLELHDPRAVLVCVGSGELGAEMNVVAAKRAEAFRILPFSNQRRMPVVYRMGQMLVLPSSHAETWGLAVNEAFACSRPALVSDQVGCAPELVEPGVTGDIFPATDWPELGQKLRRLCDSPDDLRRMGLSARQRISKFDSADAATAIMAGCLRALSMRTEA